MSNILAQQKVPRVLFFGMSGSFSMPALTALLDSGIEVSAVVIPASPLPGSKPQAIKRHEPPQVRRSILPLFTTSIIQTAWAHQIPVWEVQRLADPETLAILSAYEPDVICVACFSQRIPRTIIDLPHLGCLNVHPSLLPANRGPVPLFWTFREGHRSAGATVHFMDEGMDTGDILLQEAIKVPDGISYDLLESRCAVLGGALLARTVWDLQAGSAQPIPQDERKSSYHSFPEHEDMVIHAEEWSARHVFNFLCGLGHWDGPIELHVGANVFLLRDAISYSNDQMSEAEFYHTSAVGMWVRCRVGWVCIGIVSTLIPF